MADFDTPNQESGVVEAASEWDPSRVNHEWLWQKPGSEEYSGTDTHGRGSLGEALLALVLAAAFLFFAVLSW